MKSTMSAANPNAYLRTKVLTATPGELRMMLLDGAVKFARQGQDGLSSRDFEAAYNGISRCQAILLELINALDPPHDPELCRRLSSLYTYLYMKLVHASTERDSAAIDEVIKLLDYECETWRLAPPAPDGRERQRRCDERHTRRSAALSSSGWNWRNRSHRRQRQRAGVTNRAFRTVRSARISHHHRREGA